MHGNCMNWARLSAMHIEKDLESAHVLDSNKEYILDKTTEKLHHRKKVGDWKGLFGLSVLSVQIFML